MRDSIVNALARASYCYGKHRSLARASGLRSWIVSSAPKAAKRVTAADVARSLGLSRATVGFVLNDTPGQTIPPATRERVLAEASRLGYRPHSAARALASGRSHIVLLVLPDWPLDFTLRRNIEEASLALDANGTDDITGRNPVADILQQGFVLRVQAHVAIAMIENQQQPETFQPICERDAPWCNRMHFIAGLGVEQPALAQASGGDALTERNPHAAGVWTP